MVVTLDGIVIEVRYSHAKNASSPMVVTLDGIDTEVRDLHLKNALLPMVVTLDGIVTEFMKRHANASSPIVVTPSGMTQSAIFAVTFINVLPSSENMNTCFLRDTAVFFIVLPSQYETSINTFLTETSIVLVKKYLNDTFLGHSGIFAC